MHACEMCKKTRKNVKNNPAHLFLKAVATHNGTRGALLELMRLLDYLLQMALRKEKRGIEGTWTLNGCH